MKYHVTLKTGVMMLKVQLCHRRNKLHFEIFNSVQFKFICIALFKIQSLQSTLQEIKFLQYIYVKILCEI